ncbi:MAG: dynamin family protein [Campylobacterota bacterium]|nr:dynamin family protein [Campylobacterota bacterium]
MRSDLQEYYKTLDSISLSNSDVDKKREELKKIVDNFYSYALDISIEKDVLEQNRELSSLLRSTVKKLKEATARWKDNFNTMLEKEKFRSELENYFIVIIFGKVKAGKSSLGNFIAKNREQAQKINFFKYDEAGQEQRIKKLEEIDKDDGFATANLECTVEIQGFKLSSMAWIDTPGLGSMVEENGELAKEYIQSADYIIYPTNSSSPLQQDEKAQLKELFEQNKKVTICITKSDDIEEDEVDGKLVKILANKPKSNRDKQEQWVKDELNDILDEKKNALLGDVLSLSVHTAKAAIKNNDIEMFKNSGISSFYSLMNDVVKNKAEDLKENTPYDGLKSFIDNDILGSSISKSTMSIATLQSSIKGFEEQIVENIQEFQNMQNNLNADIMVHIDSVVAKYISSLTQSNTNKVLKKIDNELNSTISNMVDENIKKIMDNFDVSLNTLSSSLSSSENFTIKDKYETYEETYETSSNFRKFANTVTFGMVERTYDTITEEVYVGNNKNEIISNFKSNRLKGFMGVAKDNYNSIEKDFFIPLEQLSKELKTNIYQLAVTVEQFKNNLK